MAITISNQIENHRSVYFEFTGDGATTSIVVAHNRHKAPAGKRTVKAYITTGSTTFDRRSERGGLRAPTDGTAVTITSATEDTAGNVTIVTSAAVANATKAYGVIVFDQYIS